MSLEDYTEAERELRGRLGPRDFLVDLFRIGEEMRAFLDSPIGAMLVSEFRDDLIEAVTDLLEADSLTSDEARDAFMRAKVGWKTLNKIDTVIKAAADAEAAIIDDDQRGDAQ